MNNQIVTISQPKENFDIAALLEGTYFAETLSDDSFNLTHVYVRTEDGATHIRTGEHYETSIFEESNKYRLLPKRTKITLEVNL